MSGYEIGVLILCCAVAIGIMTIVILGIVNFLQNH